MWDLMPWERIERLTSWLAGISGVRAEDVPDIRSTITLGTYRRLTEGLPVEMAVTRAVTEARNGLVRDRVCGLTGRWSALAGVQVSRYGSNLFDAIS